MRAEAEERARVMQQEELQAARATIQELSTEGHELMAELRAAAAQLDEAQRVQNREREAGRAQVASLQGTGRAMPND